MNRRGFTFIEMVTVFAIIAILGAILFPVFAKAREKGRQSSCLNNLLNVGAALRLYSQDHYGLLPPNDNDLTPLLAPRYLPEAASLTCPTLRGDQPLSYRSPTPEQALAKHPGFDYVYRGGLADDDPPTQAIATDCFRDVHNQGSNVLFLDGHGKWLTSKMFTLEKQTAVPSSPPGSLSTPVRGLVALGELQVKLSGSAYLDPGNNEKNRGGDE